jgi:hypothetical protein
MMHKPVTPERLDEQMVDQVDVSVVERQFDEIDEHEQQVSDYYDGREVDNNRQGALFFSQGNFFVSQRPRAAWLLPFIIQLQMYPTLTNQHLHFATTITLLLAIHFLTGIRTRGDRYDALGYFIGMVPLTYVISVLWMPEEVSRFPQQISALTAYASLYLRMESDFAKALILSVLMMAFYLLI